MRDPGSGVEGEVLDGTPCSEGSLTIDPGVPASGQVERERGARDRDVAAVRPRGRAHDRQPEPGARARRGAGPAPEALEGGLGLRRGEPRPLVGRPPGGPARRAAATVDGDRAAPVGQRVGERGCRRRGRSASASPTTSTRRGAATATPRAVARGGRARHAVEVDGVAGGDALLALEHEQVVDEARQALGVRAQVGDRLGVGSVADEVLDVAAQRRDRRAQLVRRVGQEAPLAARAPARAPPACR